MPIDISKLQKIKQEQIDETKPECIEARVNAILEYFSIQKSNYVRFVKEKIEAIEDCTLQNTIESLIRENYANDNLKLSFVINNFPSYILTPDTAILTWGSPKFIKTNDLTIFYERGNTTGTASFKINEEVYKILSKRVSKSIYDNIKSEIITQIINRLQEFGLKQVRAFYDSVVSDSNYPTDGTFLGVQKLIIHIEIQNPLKEKEE